MALTDANGDVTDTYSYDAWGNATHKSGTTNDNPYQYVGQLGYYTHWQEQDFGLLQLGVRYYDPGFGRFVSRDPGKDGLNWYAYAHANPASRTDPWGLWAKAGRGWWWWYFFMHGKEMNLNVVGPDILTHLSTRRPVRELVWEIQGNHAAKAERKAKDACESDFTNKRKVARWSLKGYRGVNLTRKMFVLGRISLDISGKCVLIANCCKRTYQWCCGVDFTLDDWFVDALDPFNKIPGNQDLADGNPYHITGSWTENLGGEGTF